MNRKLVKNIATTAKKGNHKHFMIKEIKESPQKAKELLHLLKKYPSVPKIIDEIYNAENTYITGAGTSFHAGLLGTYYFNKLAHTKTIIAFAAEFVERFGDSFTNKDVLIGISQSGETKDVKNVMDFFEHKKHKKILSIVNVIGSSIAIRSKLFIPLACNTEIAVPATKTFINETITFLYLAMILARKKGITSPITYKDMEKLPDLLAKTIETTESMAKDAAKFLGKTNDFYSVGYGLTYPIALESALKIKETTYAHCEGMYSSEFKHGPISIVTKDYPVMFTVAKPNKNVMLGHINEVLCRGGRVLTVRPEDKDLKKQSNFYIPLPDANPFLTPIIAVIPFQLIAYYLCLQKGYNPDQPRNISKTVTVT
ncbi:MAG: SIS domain-containing protein [bacterium]|nr:SIS domain-containing protein [bacterium]